MRSPSLVLSSALSLLLLAGATPVFAKTTAQGMYAANGYLTAAENPARGEPPLQAWQYTINGSGPTITFYFGTKANWTLSPIPVGVVGKGPHGYLSPPKNSAKLWSAWDDPAPLLWYYHHDSKTGLGDSVMGSGQTYAKRLIEVLKQEHFQPAEVGVNPLNWNAVKAPKQKVSPIPPPPSGNPMLYPKYTVLVSWQWAKSFDDGFKVPEKPDQGLLIDTTLWPMPNRTFASLKSVQYSGPSVGPYTVQGKWVRFPKNQMRIDSVVALQTIAEDAPAGWAKWRLWLAPSGIAMQYSADLKAAMTVQNFNPGSLGMQPLKPSPATLTPAAEAWLVHNGWGAALAKYALAHGVKEVTHKTS